jgi:hypothetical protein
MSRYAMVIIEHLTDVRTRYIGLALAIVSTLAIGEDLPGHIGTSKD